MTEKELIELIPQSSEVTLPFIPLRGEVIMPNRSETFEAARKKSIFAAKKALSGDGFVILSTQRDNSVDVPKLEDIYNIGTVAKVDQVVATYKGIYRCMVTCICRIRITAVSARGNGMTAVGNLMPVYGEEKFSDNEMEALRREVCEAFLNVADEINDDLPQPLRDEITDTTNVTELFQALSNAVPADVADKQEMLEADSLGDKLGVLLKILAREYEILQLEARVQRQVQEAINQNQKEFYIREQIRSLQEELGESADMMGDSEEIDAYRAKIDAIAGIADEGREKLVEELGHLAKMPPYSQEAALVRNYLDVCLALPWDKFDEETADVERAAKILDEDHYSITKVKERILDNISVRALTPNVKGQIICLYGPPGTGKTSVAKSIARALGRKFVRVSLGGVRDESEIRGHRKTYIGSMPGRIIAAMRQAGVMNPVMLLDEIDKMSNDYRGDPSSAMLEVLDSEQNEKFTDHYTEIPFDLSNVLFITTANSLDTIQPPLLDRMEVIELTSYTREEKFQIAKRHLIPKQLKKYGIKASQMRINDGAVYTLIDSYTREAGVRKLEREIAALCRKAAREIVGGADKVVFKANNIENYLGHKKYTEDYFLKKPSVGCVNGLAWTSVGGVIMPLEALVLDGKGKVTLTGSLGDVMKESASIAVSNARRLADVYGIAPDFYEKKDIHIHAPEGATPKDGPSAGVTMVTALISALSGIEVRADLAMTGEITLTGKVLPIGGLKEKSMAAYKSGIRTVLIPAANEGDLSDVDEEVRSAVEFIKVETVDDVLCRALVTSGGKKTAADPSDKPVRRRGRPKGSQNKPKLPATAPAIQPAQPEPTDGAVQP